MGFYPASAQIGGPLMGGHLASLEVTRWPPMWHSILAFPDGHLGPSQPWQNSAYPGLCLYGILGLSCKLVPCTRAEASNSHVLLEVSDAAAGASVSPSG